MEQTSQEGGNRGLHMENRGQGARGQGRSSKLTMEVRQDGH